jgi:spermidine synthase
MKTLHRTRGLNHDLIVTQDGNTVTLWSGPGLRHTVVDLAAPHVPGLEYARNTLLALAFCPRAQSFLVLGLGGGSIPHMLRRARADAFIDAVEINPEIPALARIFFQLEPSERFHIYVEDAAAYLGRSETRYDAIILDAYVGDALPAQCTTDEFFENARRRLAREGVLVVNWMIGDRERYKEVIASLQRLIGPLWILHCYRSRNILLFASGCRFTRRELLLAAERIGVGRVARQLKSASQSAEPQV